MKILKITGATTHDESIALHEILAIWEQGGTCCAALMQRMPKSRVEVLIEANEHDRRAIIVIENGIVGVHPLDESEPQTIH